MQTLDPVDFSFTTHPSRYHHLKLLVSGDEATISLRINPEKSLRGDTPLKLNSYDLSVDIELADALQRLRFEHPQVSVVTITSAHPQIFSSGANIYMLKKSSHAFKVNFCKFTNETRLYLEEASRFSKLKFICGLNGTAAGGGYELALACDRIVLVDDKSANVSLPEVPLLGVLPGTGGLTRVVDKRQVRRDYADVFCTLVEGIKGKKAKAWGLVDEVYAKASWDESMRAEVAQLKTTKPQAQGIVLENITCQTHERGFSYDYVDVAFQADRVVALTIKGPRAPEPTNLSAMMEKGSKLWLLQAFRELDDALLRLRFFSRDYGLIQIFTEGDASLILDAERPLFQALADDAPWFLREVLLHIGRVLKRFDVMSRSIIAIVHADSAFVGVLAELLLIADRSYARESGATIALTPLNQGLLNTWSDYSRLYGRLSGNNEQVNEIYSLCDGRAIPLQAAKDAGLITFVLDEIDFDDELRLFKEERASLSPDALSAMEANLRYFGQETLATKIFGRLSAWQNWVFTRENATGEKGALMSYGAESRAAFCWERC